MCYVGPGVDIPCGVLIDPTSFEQEALAYFSKEGCRRTALLSTLPHGKSGESPRAKLRGFDALEPVFPGVDAGRDFAMRLLAQSQGKRPDGLAITDDYVAMGLAAALAAAGNGYKPRIAVIANRYLPLAYALPVMSFELNPDELVTGTVELLRTRILDAKAPRRITTVAPRMENPQES
jgi:DNA-binding LacI/PurR family transcriptional regulator